MKLLVPADKLTDGSCVLTFGAGVCGRVFVGVRFCMSAGWWYDWIGWNGAMPVCEYSVHDMTLRRCDARPSVGGSWCLINHWVGSQTSAGVSVVEKAM